MSFQRASAPVTLLWHDYETTGTNKQLDRPTQFAAVRTDPDLNVVGEDIMLYCQPSLDSLMHPMAAMVTGITPQECQAKGKSEADFCKSVIQELGKGGTCGVGYNTIAFDDEITRNMLYRNFRDPYEREWRGGNSRWDLITAVRLFAALRPEGIVWPTKEDGRPSQRLEDLAKANHLKQERAHDALSDVYATIQLAQLLKTTQPRLWDFAFGLRDKAKVQEVVNLAAPKPFVHVAPYYDHGGTAILYPIAQHPVNKNGIIAVNLSADLTPLFSLDVETIAERLFGGGMADDEEKPVRLPLTMIQINKAPPVAAIQALRAEDRERLGYDEAALAQCQAQQNRITQDPNLARSLAQKLQAAFQMASKRFGEPADAELALYNGFPSPMDKAVIESVKASSPDVLATQKFTFQHPKYEALFFRYRARNWPHLLSSDEHETWLAHCRTRLTTDTPATTLTLAEYRERVAALREDPAHAHKVDVLDALDSWANDLEGRLNAASVRPTATESVRRPRP